MQSTTTFCLRPGSKCRKPPLGWLLHYVEEDQSQTKPDVNMHHLTSEKKRVFTRYDAIQNAVVTFFFTISLFAPGLASGKVTCLALKGEQEELFAMYY